MINVFIDTTLTYQDPFLKTVTNRRLVDIVRTLEGTIYISRVVLQETIEHYRRNLSDRISKLSSSMEECNILLQNNIPLPRVNTIEEYINELNDFYQQLQHEGILEIVEYDNNILPEVVNRATMRRKPCSRNKAEFRDTIIWMSYCSIINERELDSCYFITNNTADFYDDDKVNLHSELVSDLGDYYDEFKLVKSSKEIIYSREINDNVLYQWAVLNVDEPYLRSIIDGQYLDDIERYIANYLSDGSTPLNVEEYTDYFELDSINISNVINIDYEIINGKIYIYSDLEIELDSRRIVYSYVAQIDDEVPYDIGGATLAIEMPIILAHNEQGYSEKMEISGIHRFREI